METRASYVTVGAFVMILVLGLIAAAIWFAEGGGGGAKVYFQTSFEGPVTGLGDGTIVRFNGIEVGNVTALASEPDKPQNVRVVFQVNADTFVRRDSEASIEQQGLTGPVFVEISGGTKESARLVGSDSATNAPSITPVKSRVQRLMEGAQRLVEDFGKVTTQVNLLLSDENRQSISELLAHLNATTAVIDSHSNDLAGILRNFNTASAKINVTLANADRALGSADSALTKADHAIGTLDETLVTARSTVQKIGQLSEHADRAVSGVDVAQLNRLLAEARVMVTNITRLSTALEREPTRILYGDSRQGYTPR